MRSTGFAFLALVTASPLFADAPVIEGVSATQTGDAWRFEVTLSHPDTGWDHYADGWRVLDMDGRVLATRVLVHPHVDEQPFTRSQSGVQVPDGATQVRIEASCNRDGWSGQTVVYTLP
jgi:hypothetical protein